MKKPSVFVVDDEVQICALLTRIMQREGYTVRSFTSGEEAAEAFSTDHPDVLITDLMMPGMSGLELVRKARQVLPSIGTILTTGYASMDNLVDALRSGVDDFVTKPFSVADIRSVVARVLDRIRVATPAAEPARSEPEIDLTRVTLARRLRDISVIESVHALIAEDPSSAELLPRSAATLDATLGVQSAALFARGTAPASFRVTSASPDDGPWASRLEFHSAGLARFAESGVAGPIELACLGAAAGLLGDGPLAAAPLCPREPGSRDNGVVVVARAVSHAPFQSEELRLLGVFSSALGDVYRVTRFAERGEDAYVGSLCDVVAATESRSPWFARHSDRVRELSVALGRRLGLAAHDLEVLEIASRLLDLGRVETPDELLAKPGHPSADEWLLLRRHAICADELVRPLGRLKHVKPVIRHHHENWDGSGYPAGLRGDEIPFLASIVRITDSYAALTSARAWRPALDGRTAVRQMVELSGRHFHPQLVAAFTKMQGETSAPGESPS